LENKEALEKGLGSIYHQESNDVDYALYLLQPQQKIIWQMLEESIGYDIPNIVSFSEIDEMKHSILNDQFIDRKYEDISSNKYVTLSKIQEFISVESQYIKNLLYPR
jgi:GTPase Era involved in 16S rRNA processing